MFKIKSSVAAFGLLRQRLGWRSAFAVGMRTLWCLQRGDPWRAIPASTSKREADSREQAGAAIVLYRVLNFRMGQEKALALMREIIIAGALIFLRSTIPPFNRQDYNQLSPSERQSALQNRIQRFPNVTLGNIQSSSEEFSFEVNHCAFVELTQRTGHPELALLFCAADRRYFEQNVPDIQFKRPQTLAENKQPCQFQFNWHE